MSKLTVSCGRRGRGGGSAESSDACRLEEITVQCHTVLFGLYSNGHCTGHTRVYMYSYCNKLMHWSADM